MLTRCAEDEDALQVVTDDGVTLLWSLEAEKLGSSDSDDGHTDKDGEESPARDYSCERTHRA